jgi:hypothetical protein
MVTGKMLAVQIKCGQSFLSEKNRWGYVYRGERKHFNYLFNYPIPVIIAVCDPDSHRCYWVHFRPEHTQATDAGWKITVPFKNELATSKDALTALVSPVRDGYAELESYWKTNKLTSTASIIIYVLDATDIKYQETVHPRAFFDRLRLTREIASQCQGKVEFTFAGYDNDARELYEIPEVREYIALLDAALPDLLFFVRTEEPTYTLTTFVLCQAKVEFVKNAPPSSGVKHVSVDPIAVMEFIERHCPALNEITEWLNMPPEDEKRLYFDVVRCLGLEVPDDE